MGAVLTVTSQTLLTIALAKHVFAEQSLQCEVDTFKLLEVRARDFPGRRVRSMVSTWASDFTLTTCPRVRRDRDEADFVEVDFLQRARPVVVG
jgi:hypothetical protein